MTDKKTAAATEAKHRQRDEMLAEVEWLIDMGCNAFDLERAFPKATINSLERAAYRKGDKELAARIHRLIVDARIAA